MRTVTYKSILEGALRLAAEDTTAAADKDKSELMESLNDGLQRAREYYRWPDVLLIEARYFRDVWAAGNYAAAAEVYHTGSDAYWSAAAPCVAGDVPGVSAKWTVMAAFNRYVDYDQAGKTAFDAVLGAWTSDPRAYADARPLDFEIAREGVRFGTDAPNQVWIELREKCPNYTYDAEWTATNFAAGKQVYDAANTGELYRAAAPCVAGDVPGVSANWVLIPIPAIFRLAVKRLAFADWLEGDGQTDKALVQSGKFTELLDDQVWQLVKLQGQNGRVTRRK